MFAIAFQSSVDKLSHLILIIFLSYLQRTDIILIVLKMIDSSKFLSQTVTNHFKCYNLFYTLQPE